jgi:hypothetical protein
VNIRLHIERLVLDGVPVSAGERSLLLAAMETELTLLLRNGGLSDELRLGGSLTQMRAGDIRIREQGGPKKLGADIAGAVHQVLGLSGGKQSVLSEHRSRGEQPLPGKQRQGRPRGNPR